MAIHKCRLSGYVRGIGMYQKGEREKVFVPGRIGTCAKCGKRYLVPDDISLHTVEVASEKESEGEQ